MTTTDGPRYGPAAGETAHDIARHARVAALTPGGTAAGPQPVVLPVRPGAGWAATDAPRRLFAVACPFLLLMVASSDWMLFTETTGFAFLWLYALAGPPAFYSAARVVRPHVGVDRERQARHWAAAVGSAYGFATLVVLFLPNGGQRVPDVSWWLTAAASVLGPVTLVWGAGSGLARVLGRGAGRDVDDGGRPTGLA